VRMGALSLRKQKMPKLPDGKSHDSNVRVVPLDFDVARNARGDVAIFYRMSVDSLLARAIGILLDGRIDLAIDNGERITAGRITWLDEQAARRSGEILLVGVGHDGAILSAVKVPVEGKKNLDDQEKPWPISRGANNMKNVSRPNRGVSGIG
jgi:hypothetical protein